MTTLSIGGIPYDVGGNTATGYISKFAKGDGSPIDPATTQDIAGVVANLQAGLQITTAPPTLTSAVGGTASVQLLPVVPTRRVVLLWNASTATLYLRWGATAAAISAGNYSVALAPGAYYEVLPALCPYALQGIWDAANGFVNITAGS
jgi:hypothetical protein